MARKKGGKKKDPRRRSKIERQAMEAARAEGALAFQPAIREGRNEQLRAKRHQGVLDAAFNDYGNYLQQSQAAVQQMTERSRQANMDRTAQLGALTAQTAGQGQDYASQQAAILGQGTGVQDAIGALAQGANQGLANQSSVVDQAMADLGIADFTNLARRGGVAERERIAQTQAAEDYRRLAAQSTKESKQDKGNYVASKFQELLQQNKQNRFQKKGLQIQAQQSKAEQALAAATLAETVRSNKADEYLEKLGIKTDRNQSNKDRKAAKDENKGSNGQTGGLSPSERDEYKQYVRKVRSVQAIYSRARKNGASPKQARTRAMRQAGGERWMVSIAKDLVDGGNLSPAARRIAKAKLPGGKLPKSWR